MSFYVSIANIRAAGITVAQASDAEVQASIDLWEQYVERWTRNFFRSVAATVTLDGNNSRVLFLSLPILTITSLQMNSIAADLPLDQFVAHNARGPVKDDRQNPRIEVRSLTRNAQTAGDLFRKGLDQVITGTFGYLESDGSTPLAVIRAIIKLVVSDLRAGGPGAGTSAGTIKRERTDDHEIEYGTGDAGGGPARFTLPRDIVNLLAPYRAPFGIAAPEPVRPILTTEEGFVLFTT